MDKTAPRARIAVKVQPRARETALIESVGVAPSAVRIVQGLSSRMKVVEIDGIDPSQVERILGHAR